MVEAVWAEKKYGSYADWERRRVAWETSQSAATTSAGDAADAEDDVFYDAAGGMLTAEQFAQLVDINHDGTIADDVTTTWGMYTPDHADRMDRLDHRHERVGGGGGRPQGTRRRIQYRRATPYAAGAVIRFK